MSNQLLEETLEETMEQNWRNKHRSKDGSYKIIKGNLYARIQYIDETGLRKEKLRKANNKTHARQLIKEMRSELNIQGENTLRSDKLSFEFLTSEYERSKIVEAEYRDGRKITGRRSILPVKSALTALKAYFGRHLLRNIKPADIEKFKLERLKTPKKDGKPRKLATVNRELELLRSMFNFAFENGWIIENPFLRAKSKSLISKSSEIERDRVMSFDEERYLLEACEGRRSHLKPLIITATDTAMRRGELFKLLWGDIDFEKGLITVQATNSKTEKERIIGMTPRVKDELNKLWELSPKKLNMSVFGITNTIKTAWKSACKEAEIEDLRFHDLRHTATTRLIRAGVPHTEVMKITGHTQIKTFLRYLNLTKESISASIDLLSAYHERQAQKSFEQSVQIIETLN